MKLNNIKIVLGFAFTFLLLSCNNSNEPLEPNTGDRVPIKIAADFTPLTSSNISTVWDANTQVGLTLMDEAGENTVANVFNYIYTTPDGSINFEPNSPEHTAYFPQDGSNVSIKAYYPYNKDLPKDQQMPVSVKEQDDLTAIDYMTAEHLAGFSKAESAVKLHFKHRMSKLIFNLSITDGDQTIPLKDFNFDITGMKTSGIYDILKEALQVDQASDQAINIPSKGKNDSREAIVLPRPAGDGVVFEFKTENGDTYFAKMSPDLVLEEGYKYTFDIKLQKTPLTVSATVEEWKEGPTLTTDALSVSTPAGESTGVKEGSEMKVYLKGDTDYDALTSFTFDKDGNWVTNNPVYWEDIKDPAEFRSSIILDEELNDTQLADILISDEISVDKNTGANFTMKHAASKVFVQLNSNTFTAEDLKEAVIILPKYEVGGKEDKGAFTPGTAKADILLDRTDIEKAVALFQPQLVAKGGTIAKVTIKGNDYFVTATDADHTFTAGEAQLLILNINKTATSMSAKVVDWVMTEAELEALAIGTATSGGENVLDGEQLVVSTGNETAREELETFTYNLAANSWTATNPVYWESLEKSTTFYGSILRTVKYNDTQLDDYLIAKPTTVEASNGVEFELSHSASKVTVQLTSSDNTYSEEELAQMSLVLPDYLTGGVVETGVFVPGTAKGNVTIEKNVGEDKKSAIAHFQPQTLKAGTTIIQVSNDKIGKVYEATSFDDIEFEAGVATLLKLDVKKSSVTMSAKVIDWIEGDEISLTPYSIKISGSLGANDDFFADKKISIYKHSPLFYENSYEYKDGEWKGEILYWDGQVTPYDVIAMHYPSETMKPKVKDENTVFDWNLPADQSKGYEDYDLLSSKLISVTEPSFINFEFAHTLSKVIIELSSDEFDASELTNTEIVLNGFIVKGTVKIADGKAKAGTTKENLIPFVDKLGSKYSALVMPQTIPASTDVVKVTLSGYPNTPFTGTLDKTLKFEPGKETVIKINLKRTSIDLSATLESWTEGETGEIVIE